MRGTRGLIPSISNSFIRLGFVWIHSSVQSLAIEIVVLALGPKAVWAILAAITVTALTGFYYQDRIGGVTGDCMGATNQMAEVAVYFAGVFLR